MCGRFSLASDPALLAAELDAVDEATVPPPGLRPDTGPRSPRFNIAPTTTVAVLCRDVPRAESASDGDRGPQGAAEPERVLRAMRWGLIPSWARDTDSLPTLFNARVETAAEKPSFRSAVRRRHCAIPMDGWYEWVPADTGGRRGSKQPFHMSPPDGTGLLMAGLWEGRRDPADDTVVELSCTILTTEAVGPLAAVHDRMPLVVPPGALDEWLDPQRSGDPRELVDRGRLTDWAEWIAIEPVSTAVSNVRNDGPELVRPVELGGDTLF